MNNSEISTTGVEVYTNKLLQLSDLYIEQVLSGNEDEFLPHFRDFLFFARDRVVVPDNDDIEGLDKLFWAFARLCARFGRLPTLAAFSLLTGIASSTFSDWMGEQYRVTSGHSQTAKKWKDCCAAYAMDELSNAKFANPNLIFIAKAAYGMRENSQIGLEANSAKSTHLSTEELIMLDADSKTDADQ